MFVSVVGGTVYCKEGMIETAVYVGKENFRTVKGKSPQQ
jgi:hypothetical protein